MAINPETQYPGKIAPSTPDYPYGAARNITVPGDGTGTPWEAALVNDLFGFQQALLSGAGIIPSGNPEKVGASQYLDAIAFLSGRVAEDYTGLKAVVTAGLANGTKFFVTGRKQKLAPGGGEFLWDSADRSTDVTNDPLGGVVVPPDSDATGASGAFIRVRLTPDFIASWWSDSEGTEADPITTPEIQAAIDYVNANGGGDLYIKGAVVEATAPIILKNRVGLMGWDMLPKRQNVNGGSGISGGVPTGVIQVKFGNGSTLQAQSAIIYQTYTKLRGIMFAYPDQVNTLATPIQFPPTLSPSTGFTQYVDFQDLEFHGSTEWMRLDSGLAGTIKNIKGACIEIGIRATNVISPTIIDSVEASASLGSPGDPLRVYSQQNGRVIVVDYADDLTLMNIKGVELKTLLECNDSSNRPADSFGTRTGSFWGQLVNPLADVCREPVVINAAEDCQINGGSLVGNTTYELRGGACVRIESLQGEANVNIDSTYFKNAATAVHCKADRGTVSISSPNVLWNTDSAVNSAARYGNKTLQGMVVINENAGCEVNCSALPGGKFWPSFVSGQMTVDGVTYGQESGRVDVTPAGIMDINNWTNQPLAGMTQVDANTIQFDTTANPSGTSESRFDLPTSIEDRAGVYIAEYEIEQDAITSDLSSATQFNIDIRENNSNIFSRLHPSNFYPNYRTVNGDPYLIKQLFVTGGNVPTPLRFNAIFGATPAAAQGAVIRIRNVKIYKLDRDAISQAMLDALYGSYRNLDTVRGRRLAIDGLGNLLFSRATSPATPTDFVTLDECKNNAPAVGQPQGWVFDGAAWLAKPNY